jgi:hypothetical protein
MVFGFLGKRRLYLVRLGLEGKGDDGSSAPMGLARQSGLACSGLKALAKLEPAELLKANSSAPIVLSDRAGMSYEHKS